MKLSSSVSSSIRRFIPALGQLGFTGLIFAVISVAGAHTAEAAGVVGMGTAASCTEAALNAALSGGGLVPDGCQWGRHA
jgi:hypothetical protein